MPHPPRRPRRSDPQLELGLTSGPSTPTAPPAWGDLPEATQQTLTRLLTRLLVAHARGAGPQPSARAGGSPDER
jgi:hypothetical protein